jgi:hypothetical protein
LAFVWGLAYYGVIPGGGLADALHIAPDELVGAATLIGLFPAALFVTWASDGRAGVWSAPASQAVKTIAARRLRSVAGPGTLRFGRSWPRDLRDLALLDRVTSRG